MLIYKNIEWYYWLALILPMFERMIYICVKGVKQNYWNEIFSIFFFCSVTYLTSVILPAGIIRTIFGVAIEIDSK